MSARAIRRLHGRRVRSAFSGDLVCARRPPEPGAGANPSPNALCPVCGELPSLPPTPTPGWTTVVNDQFNVGGVPAHWHLYDGRYESDPSNCAAPSQVTVSSGYMHMWMSYRTTGSCGSGWYTGGMQLNSAYAAVNQRITVRYRIVNTDPVHVRSHRNIPMHFGGVQSPSWPAGGEVNYCEGSALTDCTMFAHWWNGTSSGGQYTGPHMHADFTQFRTLQATRLDHVISVSIDGVLNDTYVGTSATIPDVVQRAVLQQECRSAGCPSSGLSAHSEVIQIDLVTIENAT